MQTITFYSYKGGVGRTLAVANTARYLSSLGQRVFCIDFDLEAPGLHHKFKLSDENQTLPELGLTDYIYNFSTSGAVPPELEDYVVEIGHARAPEGPIWLMPAGAVPSPKYWERLATLNWHDLFYSPSAPGVALFVALKEAIRSIYEPDFLLIDARTGITEAGGVATTILPDVVVCLLLQTVEHLEGARAVMKSIGNAKRLGSDKPIEVRPVLSRLPAFDSDSYESDVVAHVLEYLEEPTEQLGDDLELAGELRVLHGDPDLEREERLLIGPGADATDSALLQDYLRLCGDLVPRESITDRIGDLIQNAMANLLEAPEQAERNLEALARYSDHPDAYRELIKVYRLRHDSEHMVQAATHLWRLTTPVLDPLVVEVVIRVINGPNPSLHANGLPTDLAEAVWKASGEGVDLGVLVARGYGSENLLAQACEVVDSLLTRPVITPAIATLALHIYVEVGRLSSAEEIIDQYASGLARSSEFVSEWAKAATKIPSYSLAQKLLNLSRAKSELKAEDPGAYIQVMRVAGADELALAAAIDESTMRLVRSIGEGRRQPGWRGTITKIAREFIELHDEDALEQLVQEELPNPLSRELLATVSRSQRRPYSVS